IQCVRTDRDCGLLACACRSEQRKELTRLNFQTDAVDRIDLRLAIALDEVFDLDHRGVQVTALSLIAAPKPGSACSTISSLAVSEMRNHPGSPKITPARTKP